MRYDYERRMTNRRKHGKNHPLRRYVGRNKPSMEVTEERVGSRRQRYEDTWMEHTEDWRKFMSDNDTTGGNDEV